MTRKPHVARREAHRFLKFLAVGALGFLVDTGALSALVFLIGLDRRAAKGVGFCAAVLTGFVLNRLWAYRESRSKPVLAQATQFLFVSLVGLGINVLVFSLVDHALQGHAGAVWALYAAQVCAVGTALVWNFIANRFITYGDVELGH